MLTVVVQTFRRPDYLRTCLCRLRDQLLQNLQTPWELIIADDGSADTETENILASSYENFGCSLVIRNPDRTSFGPGVILNEATNAAQGDIILHIEDDFFVVNTFTEESLLSLREAFSAIPTLGLIRLRVLDNTNASAYRLREYTEKTEPDSYLFRGNEFKLYKRTSNGGTNYQYTGNAHARLKGLISALGGYPVHGSLWHLENVMKDKFQKSDFRSGIFRNGWFDHFGKITTKGFLEDHPHYKERAARNEAAGCYVKE